MSVSKSGSAAAPVDTLRLKFKTNIEIKLRKKINSKNRTRKMRSMIKQKYNQKMKTEQAGTLQNIYDVHAT